jgi:hypothetical protein
VMIGPAHSEIHGATAVARHPHTVLELPLDELSGASMRLHFSRTAVEKWAGVAGALSLPPGEVDVALEVASPVAVARIAVRKAPPR